MKFSIVLPYYKRASLLSRTLDSFRRLYRGRTDYEVIIIEDTKNKRDGIEAAKLRSLIREFPDLEIVCLLQDKRPDTMCPGTAYNMGIAASRGEYIVISNPECMHEQDILAGLDTEFSRDPGCYVVCACLGLDEQGNPATWYQHGQHKDHKLNHCTAISRVNYDRIGGFDEAFADGYARTDIDFVWAVMNAGIPIVERDDLLTVHQWHPRGYGIPVHELRRLMDISVARLRAKWQGKKINYDQAWVKRVQEACW